MDTTKTKNGRLRRVVLGALLLVVITGGLYLGLCLLGDYTRRSQEVSFDKAVLERIYSTLSKYRETYGRWPATIEEAADQLGTQSDVSSADGVFHRPWLYYPNAKPDSKEVLVAVPDVIRMRSLPFIGWQDAVLADGTFVDFRSRPISNDAVPKPNH